MSDINFYLKMRQNYGLSRMSMSKVLGFGVNQWKKYEEGIPPSNSHGMLIKTAKDPVSFKKMLMSNEDVLQRDLGKRKFERLLKRVDEILRDGDKMTSVSYSKWVEGLYQ